MNILFLTNHLNVGGITSYCLTLATGLKKRGHNIYVASSAGELLPRFIDQGIKFIQIPIKTKQDLGPKVLMSKFKLINFLKSNQIDILHSNSRTTQILGCLLSRKTGIPHVSTCHGFFKKRFFRRVFPCWGIKTIAISASVKEHLMQDFAVKEEDIRVIHSGVDVLKFAAISRDGFGKTKLGLGEGPVVGIIARLSVEKGHIYLIQAMQEVVSEIPAAQLLIIGEGRMQKGLFALRERLGLQKHIFFIPSITDTSEILSVMDIFVLPSTKEGLGLSLMEAMAAGVCVIGTDVGGIKSLIQDGVNGLVVKPADARGLSAVISGLLKDSPKRESLAREGQRFIAQNFSQEKMVSETERVYSECLNLKD
ncbi:MAG: hypothetical protein A2984_01765 [Omnitrophica WOR_2 bacterium RIFCSPLOWO2_01_FULL_41_12]|nr:MAG: hypothetical protein A2984_01765 [Omnitrophica WOR_2 bacterium RIFCSPLOWO2_01_FULL_41_12]